MDARGTPTRMSFLVAGILFGLTIMFGFAQADSAGITKIQIIDKDDRDCDGYASGYTILIAADAECHGCNDEDSQSPNIEPFFVISLSGPNGNHEKITSSLVDPDADLVYEHRLSDLFEVSSAGDVEIEVKMKDEDPVFNDEIDQSNVVKVAAEPPSEDPSSRPKAFYKFDEAKSIRDKFLLFFTSNEVLVNESIRFDASASSYSDCPVSSYKWDFDGDGNHDKQGKKVTHIFQDPGAKEVSLTVINKHGDTDTYVEEIIIYEDTDGDGISNNRELSRGTDPENKDSDRDLVDDKIDPLPKLIWVPIGPWLVFMVIFVYGIVVYQTDF